MFWKAEISYFYSMFPKNRTVPRKFREFVWWTMSFHTWQFCHEPVYQILSSRIGRFEELSWNRPWWKSQFSQNSEKELFNKPKMSGIDKEFKKLWMFEVTHKTLILVPWQKKQVKLYLNKKHCYISLEPIKSPMVFRQLFGAGGSRVRISGQKILSAPLLNFQKNIGFVCVRPIFASQIGRSKVRQTMWLSSN